MLDVEKTEESELKKQREEIIKKIERERDFQRRMAKEYSTGILRDEVTFARYDQAAKILDWVLGLLKEKRARVVLD